MVPRLWLPPCRTCAAPWPSTEGRGPCCRRSRCAPRPPARPLHHRRCCTCVGPAAGVGRHSVAHRTAAEQCKTWIGRRPPAPRRPLPPRPAAPPPRRPSAPLALLRRRASQPLRRAPLAAPAPAARTSRGHRCWRRGGPAMAPLCGEPGAGAAASSAPRPGQLRSVPGLAALAFLATMTWPLAWAPCWPAATAPAGLQPRWRTRAAAPPLPAAGPGAYRRRGRRRLAVQLVPRRRPGPPCACATRWGTVDRAHAQKHSREGGCAFGILCLPSRCWRQGEEVMHATEAGGSPCEERMHVAESPL